MSSNVYSKIDSKIKSKNPKMGTIVAFENEIVFIQGCPFINFIKKKKEDDTLTFKYKDIISVEIEDIDQYRYLNIAMKVDDNDDVNHQFSRMCFQKDLNQIKDIIDNFKDWKKAIDIKSPNITD